MFLQNKGQQLFLAVVHENIWNLGNSLVVHAQESQNGFSLDGALVGGRSHEYLTFYHMGCGAI